MKLYLVIDGTPTKEEYAKIQAEVKELNIALGQEVSIIGGRPNDRG